MLNPKIEPLFAVLASRLVTLRASLAELLAASKLRDRQGSGGIAIIGATHRFDPLPPEMRAVQANLKRDFTRWIDLVRGLLASQHSSLLKITDDAAGFVLKSIEQRSGMWEAISAEVARKAWEYLDELSAILEQLHSNSTETTLVPDTNALIFNPALEEWSFSGNEPFTLVLTPTVLSELDELKEGRHGKSRAMKAVKLVRQIGEYRRRGPLLDGVPLRKGRSAIAAVAPEPRVATTLPWLDSAVSDDRLIATFVEIARERLRAPVALVSRDGNLRNKADMAGIICIDPPEPTSAAKRPKTPAG